MREFKVKGNTPSQKIEHMETIIARLARRAHKTVGVVVPSIPVSLYIPDAGGESRSYLSPMKGEIKTIFAKALWDSFVYGSLHMEIKGEKKIPGCIFSISKETASFDVSISVEEGDELIFSLHDIRGKKSDEPIPQFAAVVSFLFTPAVSKESIKETAISSLEDAADEIVSN